MALSDRVRRTEARLDESRGAPRRRLVVLALMAGLATAILVRAVIDRSAQRTLVSPFSTTSSSRPLETATSQPEPLSAPTRGTPSAKLERNGAIDAAVGDFERAFQAASEEDLDLIVATRLPDIVRRDPRKAVRFMELQPPSKQREVLVRHIARLWGERDAEDAVAWAQTLPDAQESALARRAVCLSLSQTNPAAAVERCAENGADAGAEADFQGIFQAWVQSDPASAGEWVAAQPTSPGLDKLRQRQVHVLARSNPLIALRMAQEGFTVPADRNEAVLAALHQWGLRDPAAARDWVSTSAPDELKARALAEIEGLESYADIR